MKNRNNTPPPTTHEGNEKIYAGSYASVEEYARELVENSYHEMHGNVSSLLMHHVNITTLALALEVSREISVEKSPDGQLQIYIL